MKLLSRYWPALIPILSIVLAAVFGCSNVPVQKRAKPDVDPDYTLSVPNQRIINRGCTTAMSFPHVEKDGVVIHAQSLLRCEGNQLALLDDETGRMYNTQGMAWMP